MQNVRKFGFRLHWTIFILRVDLLKMERKKNRPHAKWINSSKNRLLSLFFILILILNVIFSYIVFASHLLCNLSKWSGCMRFWFKKKYYYYYYYWLLRTVRTNVWSQVDKRISIFWHDTFFNVIGFVDLLFSWFWSSSSSYQTHVIDFHPLKYGANIA